MNNIKDFEKAMYEKANEYFEKYVSGKTVNEVLYNFSKKIILNLGWILAECQIINLCLNAIKADKAYYDILNKETQKKLCDTICGIKEISKDIEDILIPIIEGME